MNNITQVKSLKEICEDFAMVNFKELILDSTDEKYHLATGLRYKIKEGLFLPNNFIRDIVRRSYEIKYTILMPYLLTCMIQQNKSSFRDIVFRTREVREIYHNFKDIKTGKYKWLQSKMYKAIEMLLMNKEPSMIFIELLFLKEDEKLNNFVITRLPALCANLRILHLNFHFIYKSEFVLECPNLKTLSLSSDGYVNSLSSLRKNLHLSEFPVISFPPENLEELILIQCRNPRYFLEHLKTFTNLEKLILKGILVESFVEITDTICCLKQLKWLEFYKNSFAIVGNFCKQVTKILHELPYLNHLEIIQTGREYGNGLQTISFRMRHVSYLEMENCSIAVIYDEKAQSYIKYMNSNAIGFNMKVPEIFEKQVCFNAHLRFALHWPYHVDNSFLTVSEETSKHIAHVICRILSGPYKSIYKTLKLIFVWEKKPGFSESNLQTIFKVMFSQGLPKNDVLNRLTRFLGYLRTMLRDNDFEIADRLLHHVEWTSALSGLTSKNLGFFSILISEVIETYEHYYLITNQPLPHLSNFLKGVLPLKHLEYKRFFKQLNDFIELLGARHEDCHHIIESFALNTIPLRRSSRLMLHSTCRKRQKVPVDDSSMQPTAAKMCQ